MARHSSGVGRATRALDAADAVARRELRAAWFWLLKFATAVLLVGWSIEALLAWWVANG